jgi:ABC-type Fe3+/spermidine/putrescine transport system ATPase subunit
MPGTTLPAGIIMVEATAPSPSTAATGLPLIRFQDVTKRFGSVTAVDRVSLDIFSGTFVTLLGPSGCGKTTMLRVLAGFYTPDGGTVEIGGRVVNDVPPHRRNTAMVFQDYALFPHMRVRENVAYGLKVRGTKRGDIRTRVNAVLAQLGLSGLGDRSPFQLSGGQQQRVALARALVLDPAVLLLDEPLSNLDAKLRGSVREELVELQRTTGVTAVYVTHDQEEALAMSDVVAVMEAGRIVQAGTPWEVYYQPRTRFVADFVGLVTLLEGTLLESGPEGASVRVGEVVWRTAAVEDARPGDAVLLSIRPETVQIVSEDDGGPNTRRAMILHRTFLGSAVRYTAEVDGHRWLIQTPDPAGSGLHAGEVSIHIPPERVHVIPSR